MSVPRDILFGAALVLAFAPARVWAGDLGLAGTPVVHRGEACLTRVDRGVDPIVQLDYTIPSIDICLNPDEPPDSRTHQFIAFCRDAPVTQTVPQWLTREDLEVSHALDLLDPDDLTVNQDVLEDSAYFAGCVAPIQGAGERRAITCEAARPGVAWDTRGLPAGPQVVFGYTYSPPLNHWQRRRGVFRLHDGDLDAAPPAAAIFTGDLEYAVTPDAPDGPLTWQPFLSAIPAPTGALALEFTSTPELAGRRITFRLLVEDPQGRLAVAHMPGKVFILNMKNPAPTPGDPGDTPPDDPYDFCSGPSADDLPKCSAAAPEPDTGGCTCSATGSPAPALLCLLALATRCRRRDNARIHTSSTVTE